MLGNNQVHAAIDAYLSAENFAALPDTVFVHHNLLINMNDLNIFSPPVETRVDVFAT